MAETIERKELEDLQQDLHDVQELLRRHRLVESLVERQQMPKHELVESLVATSSTSPSCTRSSTRCTRPTSPTSSRRCRSTSVSSSGTSSRPTATARSCSKLSDAVRESLIRSMDSDELVAAAESLDTDEIADLAPDLPDEVIQDVFQALPVEEREQLRAAMSYPEDAVGALMDFDVVSDPRGRHARGRHPLPAPVRRAARSHRPAVRRRSRTSA